MLQTSAPLTSLGITDIRGKEVNFSKRTLNDTIMLAISRLTKGTLYFKNNHWRQANC
jgi:hypothetical protein